MKIVIIRHFKIHVGASPIDPRPAPSGNKHSHPSSAQVEVQNQTIDQVEFSNNFMLGNPIYFIANLTEIISQTIMAKETNKNLDLFQVISNLAGKR